MKARVLMIAGVFLAALPAPGQSQKVETTNGSCFERISSYSRQHLENAAANYAAGLKSGVDGVVEASIAYSTLLRVAAPELDLSDIRAELENIAVSGNAPALRYKAYLATIVFENPSAFEGVLGVGADTNQFFGTVAEQASRTLLGCKSE